MEERALSLIPFSKVFFSAHFVSLYTRPFAPFASYRALSSVLARTLAGGPILACFSPIACHVASGMLGERRNLLGWAVGVLLIAGAVARSDDGRPVITLDLEEAQQLYKLESERAGGKNLGPFPAVSASLSYSFPLPASPPPQSLVMV